MAGIATVRPVPLEDARLAAKQAPIEQPVKVEYSSETYTIVIQKPDGLTLDETKELQEEIKHLESMAVSLVAESKMLGLEFLRIEKVLKNLKMELRTRRPIIIRKHRKIKGESRLVYSQEAEAWQRK